MKESDKTLFMISHRIEFDLFNDMEFKSNEYVYRVWSTIDRVPHWYSDYYVTNHDHYLDLNKYYDEYDCNKELAIDMCINHWLESRT